MRWILLAISCSLYASYPEVDYFTRTANASLGPNWVQSGGFDVSSNNIRAVGGTASDNNNMAEWSAGSAPANDQYSYVTGSDWDSRSGSATGGVGFRLNAASENGYSCMIVAGNAGVRNLRISRWTAGVQTTLTSGSTSVVSIPGSSILIGWAVGTTLNCSVTDSSGVAILTAISTTDATYTSGRVGVVRGGSSQNITFGVWWGGDGVGNDVFVAPTVAGNYYVSSQITTHNGAGTVDAPWSYLDFFANQSRLPCGSTLWFRGGTYTPNLAVYNESALFKLTRSCTVSDRITYRSFIPDLVIFDAALPCSAASGFGLLTITGDYTIIDGGFLGWQFTNSDTTCKVITRCGSNPDPNPIRSVIIQADYVSIRNVHLNDNAEGFTDNTSGSDGTELTGNLVTNNGWNAPDREHGHGGYSHNDNGVQKLIRHSVYARNYEYQTKLYSQTGANVGNYAVTQSVFLGGRPGFSTNNGLGFLVQGDNPDNITFDQVFNYGNTFEFNMDNKLADGFSLTNSYIDGGWRLNRTIAGVSTNNVFSRIGTPTGGAEYSSQLFNDPTSDTMPEAWANMDNNTYFRLRTGGNDFYAGVSPVVYAFAAWQALGVDAASTYSSTVYPASGTSPSASSPQAAVVMPHPLKTGTGLVTIINYRQDATVDADISTILAVGDPYEVLDTQCWSCGPVQTGTYTGGTIALPMTLTTIQPPAGNYGADPGSTCTAVSDIGSPSAHALTSFTHTEANINAFVVRRRQVYRTVVQSMYNDKTGSTQVTTESGPTAADLSFPPITLACSVSSVCSTPIQTQLVGDTFYRLTFKDVVGGTVWQSSVMRVPVQ